MNVFDGKVYGFPFSSERRFNNAVLFNQDKMNEVGYDHINKDRALTFDEMRDAAKKIAATGMPGFIIGGNQLGRWSNTATMLAQRGGLSVGAVGLQEGMDMTTGEYVYGADEYVAGVELLLLELRLGLEVRRLGLELGDLALVRVAQLGELVLELRLLGA